MPDLAVVVVSSDQIRMPHHHRFLVNIMSMCYRFRDRGSANLCTIRNRAKPETYIMDRGGVLRRKFVSARD
jgi:hypothetical protein